MSIYDRPYYAEQRLSNDGLIRGHSSVAVLLALNIAIFVLWQFQGLKGFLSDHFTVSRFGLFQDLRVYTLLSYAFSHQEFFHIFFNMLALFVFGKSVDGYYGPRDFLLLYLYAALVAAACHLAFSPSSALGASGSVMGIVVAGAFLEPDRPISLLLPIPVTLKLKWLALGWVVLDLLYALNPQGDFVAHGAHLGGALAGYLFYQFDLRLFAQPGRTAPGFFRKLWLFLFPSGDYVRLKWRVRWRRIFGRRAPLAPVERPAGLEATETFRGVAAEPVDPQTAERVDALLAKISRDGIGALSEEERAFLEHSSRKYRR